MWLLYTHHEDVSGDRCLKDTRKAKFARCHLDRNQSRKRDSCDELLRGLPPAWKRRKEQPTDQAHEIDFTFTFEKQVRVYLQNFGSSFVGDHSMAHIPRQKILWIPVCWMAGTVWLQLLSHRIICPCTQARNLLRWLGFWSYWSHPSLHWTSTPSSGISYCLQKLPSNSTKLHSHSLPAGRQPTPWYARAKVQIAKSGVQGNCAFNIGNSEAGYDP